MPKTYEKATEFIIINFATGITNRNHGDYRSKPIEIENEPGYMITSELPGGLNESKLPGYSETIKSTEIISFDYSGHLDHNKTSFYVSAHMTDTNSVHIICKRSIIRNSL